MPKTSTVIEPVTAPHLALFFTLGNSLESWRQCGILEREVAVYRRLRTMGFRVSFVTYGDRSDTVIAEALQGIEVLYNRYGLPAKLYEYLLPRLHGKALQECDVFKTNQTNGGQVALCAARLWRKPLIARCGYMWSEFAARQHGQDSPDWRSAVSVERRVFSEAARVVVTTRSMRDDVQTRILNAGRKTVIIPNYVDTETFQPEPDRQNTARIVFVGRLSAQKNVAALLEAIEPLNVTATIVGVGDQEESLKQRFGTLNGRIEWVGNMPHRELPQLLNAATVFVMPSLYEGHPKALLEAMSCGLPVIGADSPGIRELLEHGVNGYLCAPTAAGVRAAVMTLGEQPTLSARLGQAAREYVVANFSLDRVVEREVALIREVDQEWSVSSEC